MLHFSYKLVNNIFVNNAKKPASSGGFPITHFLAIKEENPNQKMKQQLELKFKQQVRVKLFYYSAYIRTCQKVEK